MVYLKSRPTQGIELIGCNSTPLTGVAVKLKALLALEPPGLRQIVAIHCSVA